MDISEEAEIVFMSDQLGNWKFFLSGIGLAPTKFPVQQISSKLDETKLGSLHFKNPFKAVLNLEVFQECSQMTKKVFKLINKDSP